MPEALFILALLLLFTGYPGFMFVRNRLFDRGLLRAERVPCRVISVGNLSAGGTGKTPITGWLLSELDKRGLRPALISRGYRSAAENSIVTVKEDARAEDVGDEPLWLKRQFPKIPVVVGRDKVAAAASALASADVDVLVADDAFQHRRLFRNLDIVLLDTTAPPWQWRQLPWGRMREGWGELHRAGAIFLTKCNWSTEQRLHLIGERLKRFAPAVPVFQFSYRLRQVLDLQGASQVEWGKGTKLAVLAAIANPRSLANVVTSNGWQCSDWFTFSDHHQYRQSDLDQIFAKMRSLGLACLLTTEKDAVKLRHLRWDPEIQVAVAGMAVELLGDREMWDGFLRGWLGKSI